MDMPRWVYRTSMRLRALFRGGALDRELDEELRFHFDHLVEEHVARGLTPEAARREALLAIGGIERRKEECRDSRGVALVDDAVRDLRSAFRTLGRAPAFTTAALLTLALGLGATVAMFTVVNGVLLRPLPFPEPDRLHAVSLAPSSYAFRGIPGMADRTFVAFRERDRTFEHLAALTTYKANLTGAGDPVVIPVGNVTTEFFDALGVRAALGRTFVPDDGQEGRERAVVMSDRLWRTQFGSDPAIVGKPITLNGLRHTVVGVMPAGFDFPRGSAAWSPFIIRLDPGNSWLVTVIGRLKPGVTVGQARAALDAAIPALPEGPGEDRARWTIGIFPLVTLLVGEVRWPLQLFAAAVLLVLLIACANVANLLLARASAREREMAVRAALGASRARLVRQLLTESALLSFLGAGLGVLLAHLAVPALLALAPVGRIPRLEMIRIDAWVLAFATAVAAAATLTFGLAPALRLARRRFAGTLLPGGRTIETGQERFRAALVVGQIALALVLLAAAGLLARSFVKLRGIDNGFDVENVVRMSVELPEAVYPDPDVQHAFHREILARLSALPGVEVAALVNWLPLGEMHLNGDFRIEGNPQTPAFNVDKPAVSPGYFRAMGIRVLRGREFSDSDQGSSSGVAIVSRSVAGAIDPAEDVIGRRVTLESRPAPEDWLTIIGVVNDVKQTGPSGRSHAAIYRPYSQVRRPFFLSHMTYVVRTTPDARSVIPAVRSVLRSVDGNQPATAIGLMDDVLDAATAGPEFYASLLGTFAVLALALALVGTYGVIAYSVAERRHEIGVRMALGARGRSVLWLVVRRTLTPGAAGVAIGVAGAWFAARLLESFLFETAPTDPVTFAAVALTVFTGALLAGLIPARRATQVDPVVTLRHE